MRLVRSAVAGVLLGLATMSLAGPASAHGQDAPLGSDFRVTVTSVEPTTAGVEVRAVEGGARLELSNTSGRTVEILGLQGEPFLRVRFTGVEENRNSPTLAASRTLKGVPTDAVGSPDWVPAHDRPVVRWHEERARAEAPGRTWSVPLLIDGGTPAVVRGTVAAVAAPSAAWWWLAGLAGAAVLALLLARWNARLLVAAVALVCGGVAVALTVATARAATTPGEAGEFLTQLVSRAWPLLTGLAAVAAGVVTLLRRTTPDFALAVAGASVAFMAGLANGAVFGHAVLTGPSWSRPAVAVVVALGTGLTIGSVLRWYRRMVFTDR